MKYELSFLYRSLFLFVFSSSYFFSHSLFSKQITIDSLSVLIKNEKNDSSKVIHLNILAREFINTGNYDSSLYFSNSALKVADAIISIEKSESVKNQIKNYVSVSYTNMGLANWRKSNFDQAISYYSKSLEISRIRNNKNQIATSLSSIAGVYLSQGNHTTAIEYYLDALKVAEQVGDKKIIAKCFNGIGNVYGEQLDYVKTLDYYEKALKIYNELGAEDKVASLLLNIGTIYYYQNSFDSAMYYYKRAQNIFEKINDKNGLAYIYGNIGLIYHMKGELKKGKYKIESDSLYSLALPNFLKSLQLNEEFGSRNLVAVQLGNIGSLYISQEKYKEAEIYLLKALAIDTAIGYVFHLENTHGQLRTLYDKKGDYKKALYHSMQREIMKDSIFNMEKNKDLTKKELTYQFEKKEALANAEQEKLALLAEEESKKQKIVIFSTIGILLVVISFLFFVYRSLQNTRKQNKIIENQKQKVLEQNKEISIQKRLVEEKNREIVDSITYAKRIQTSFLTSEVYINRHLKDYFILYKPKDVVSGDFYWMHAKNNYFYFCIGDCTGHGIPGAFMSLIGMGVLNEIINSKQIENTNEMLNELRKIIILALNPEGSIVEGKDGMDLVLVRLNLQTLELQYSAANNTFYVCRDKELLKFKGDKMPVGKYHDIESPFASYSFQLQKGDVIYGSTDGFYDQFGGPKGKKIMTKGFEEHLNAISRNPLNEQKDSLEKIFMDWKGEIEQIDDVTVLGIKI